METYRQPAATGTMWAATPLRYRNAVIAAVASALSVAATVVYPYVLRNLFHLSQSGRDTPLHIHLLRFLLFLAPLLLIGFIIAYGAGRVGLWLHQHRFALGFGIVLAAVLFNLNGSSLGMWNYWLGRDMSEGVVWGTPRAIRSDEYVVGTPLAFAQGYNDYGYFNSLFGNNPADMFIIKDAPVWTLAELFRPFHWGYLLFGSAQGLAFYWSARLVVLFLSAYQFFLCVTTEGKEKYHKGIACLGASLIAFAPLVQWWFAVNSLPELLIAVFISIVCFDRYLVDNRIGRRAIYMALILCCAGMFALSLYPAWQITLGYVLAVLIIYTVVRHWHIIRVTRADVLILVLEILVFAAIMSCVVVNSMGTIQATLNTVYPGSRQSTGGGYNPLLLMSSTGTLLLPFKSFVNAPGISTNPTEVSLFVDLFPLGAVLSIVNMVQKKRADVLSIGLIAVVAILAMFSCLGFPLWLSRAMLLTSVPSGRATVALGVANIILLVRAVALKQWKLSAPWAISAAAGFSIITALAAHLAYPAYIGKLLTVCCFAICLVLACSIFVDHGRLKTAATSIAVLGLLASGLSVNPIQYSTAPLTQQPLTKQVQALEDVYPGQWATTGDDSSRLANLLVANGVDTFNALKVTPDMASWKKLDPQGKWEHVYNRYAFVTVQIEQKDQTNANLFELTAPDAYTLHVTPAQLAEMGVTNVLSSQELSKIHFDKYSFEPIGQEIDGHVPYRLIER